LKRIEFSDDAAKFLLKCDRTLAKKLISKVELLNKFPIPLDIKKIKGIERTFRIRFGSYRIIFQIYEKSFFITKIGHRKDVYK